ncbi:hypothetical protein TRFO_15674 [Tritrichomonas foetus]|uniref:Protein kinase domain-containing protein n=1 Tax=Tritrichomonas foetus TaxID=1144522 RepID=A0A1J4KRX7_9EUKA|nr:hypothetical protein TRFO_15674 [Tritrichomonas foetus]|eukprot:OHT14019.1 hypothetical protein TRFO_15674 [Tritrichomonas foetus]
MLLSDLIVQKSDFQVIKVLGDGSYGVVSLVLEIATKKLYAMKEFKYPLTDKVQEQQFFREVELMSYTSHPAVLHLRGFSTVNVSNRPMVVFDYMPNDSLQVVVSRRRKFTPTQKMIAMFGIAEAMRYLHSRKIVHRDLKPGNVLLNVRNEPVVCDFGLSKFMPSETLRQTQPTGSPVYMAPELMRREEYSNAVDVYAYAYVCLELLTEKEAFSEIKTVLDLVNAVCQGVRPPLENETKIPHSYKQLISISWSPNPEERPTFEEIVEMFLQGKLTLEKYDQNIFMEYVSRITYQP